MLSWHSDLALLADFQGDCIKLHSEQPYGDHENQSACLPTGHTAPYDTLFPYSLMESQQQVIVALGFPVC